MSVSSSTAMSVGARLQWNRVSRPVRRTHGPQDVLGRSIDNDRELLEASYQLRYRVYCLERRFLKAADYPDQLEYDEFDRSSIHIGLINRLRETLATSRLVTANGAGFPLFRHCDLYPHESHLYGGNSGVVEISRVCISRDLREGRTASTSSIAMDLYRATYQESRRRGFTHWLAAMPPSQHRLLTAILGFPMRAIGPQVDYFGPVTPYLLDLQEVDRAILSGTRPRLRTFLDGLEPQFHPGAKMGAA